MSEDTADKDVRRMMPRVPWMALPVDGHGSGQSVSGWQYQNGGEPRWGGITNRRATAIERQHAVPAAVVAAKSAGTTPERGAADAR